MKLYKYIGIDKFYNMLKDESFYLVNPTKWDDPYENFILRAFEPKSDSQQDIEYSDLLYLKLMKKCKEYDKNYCSKKGIRYKGENEIKNILAQIYYLSKMVFCTCMTKDDHQEIELGSDAMWRSYSNEKRSVRFEYDFENILEYDKYYITEENKCIAAINMIYNSTVDLNDMISDITSDGRNLYLSLFYKRETFKYENEVRILVAQALNEFLQKKDAEYFSKLCVNSRSEFINSFNDIYPIKAEEYNKVKLDTRKIKSVLIHPLAEESTVFYVEQMCEKFELPKPKKSMLYSIKIF